MSTGLGGFAKGRRRRRRQVETRKQGLDDSLDVDARAAREGGRSHGQEEEEDDDDTAIMADIQGEDALKRAYRAARSRLAKSGEMSEEEWEATATGKAALIQRLNLLPAEAYQYRVTGNLLLHWACRHARDADVLRTVIQRTGDKPEDVMRISTEYGGLPLHCVAFNRWLTDRTLRWVMALNREAAHMPNESGNLPLHNLLRFHVALSTGLAQVLIHGYPEAMELHGSTGQVPLHKAARNGTMTPDVFMYLIEQYPHAIGMSDDNGDTPLHVLCDTYQRSERAENIVLCIRELVKIDPQLLVRRNKYSDTALDLLCGTPALRALEWVPSFFRQTTFHSTRLHVCGNGGVGKSTLCAALGADGGGASNCSGSNCPTAGVSIRRLNLRHPWHATRRKADEGASEVERVQLFDHGARSRLHVRHSSLFSQHPAVYLLVIPTNSPLGYAEQALFRDACEATHYTPEALTEDEENELWLLEATESVQLWLTVLDGVAHPDSQILVVCNLWEDPADTARGSARASNNVRNHQRVEMLEKELKGMHTVRERQYLVPIAEDVIPVTALPHLDRGDTDALRAQLFTACAATRAKLSMPTLCKRAYGMVRQLREEVFGTGDALAAADTTMVSIASNPAGNSTVDFAARKSGSHPHLYRGFITTVPHVTRMLRVHFRDSHSTPSFFELKEEQTSLLLRCLEGCGEVLCWRDDFVVLDPAWFCNDVLGQLFALELTDAYPLDGSPCDPSHLLVSARQLDAWTQLPRPPCERSELSESVARALFRGDACVLPGLLADMGWCACASPANKRARAINDDQARVWLPLFRFAHATMPDEAMQDLVCESIASEGGTDSAGAAEGEGAKTATENGDNERGEALWVRVGRRLQCSQALAVSAYALMQARALALFADWNKEHRRQRLGGGQWSARIWTDGVRLAETHPAAGLEDVGPVSVVLRLVRGEASNWGLNPAVDVYVTGPLAKRADWMSTTPHRLWKLADDIVHQVMQPCLKELGDEETHMWCLNLQEFVQIPDTSGGTARGCHVPEPTRTTQGILERSARVQHEYCCPLPVERSDPLLASTPLEDNEVDDDDDDDEEDNDGQDESDDDVAAADSSCIILGPENGHADETNDEDGPPELIVEDMDEPEETKQPHTTATELGEATPRPPPPMFDTGVERVLEQAYDGFPEPDTEEQQAEEEAKALERMEDAALDGDDEYEEERLSDIPGSVQPQPIRSVDVLPTTPEALVGAQSTRSANSALDEEDDAEDNGNGNGNGNGSSARNRPTPPADHNANAQRLRRIGSNESNGTTPEALEWQLRDPWTSGSPQLAPTLETDDMGGGQGVTVRVGPRRPQPVAPSTPGRIRLASTDSAIGGSALSAGSAASVGSEDSAGGVGWGLELPGLLDRALSVFVPRNTDSTHNGKG